LLPRETVEKSTMCRLFLIALLVCASTAKAAAEFPDRPIRLVAPQVA